MIINSLYGSLAGLSITKEADKTSGLKKCDTVTFTITVTNTGNVTLENVAVSDNDTGFSTSIISLAAGASNVSTTTHVITQADVDAGSYSNTATVSAKGGDLTDKITETVTTSQNPGLSITKEADKTSGLKKGDTVTFTITVTNTGDVTLKNISVSDESTGFSKNIESLAAGTSDISTTTHEITLADMKAGSYKDTAIVSATDSQNNPIKDSSSETVKCTNPNIPQTGDDNRSILWLGLIILSLVGIILLVVLQKRSNNQVKQYNKSKKDQSTLSKLY